MTKILIVDDELHVREILSSLLSDKGYELEQAGSAEHARGLLGSQHFSLILLDIRLPGDSGLDLLQFVTKEHPDTAVVMVSGIDEPDVARKAFEHGAFGYILKPFEPHDVYVNVNNALRRRELEIENRDYREDLENKVAMRTQELQRNEQRLRLLLDSITAGIIIVRESDQRVVDVNQALVSMSGFPREEIIELPCEESVCIQPIDQCPVPGGRSEGGCETELRTASGQRIPVLRAVRSVHIDGEAHFLATIIDISAL
ncbi:MAG: response regulator, partial [Desulfohalobiaceae bacterium]